ncbi:hypothetical protein CDAR_449931 [Caerostris darwini]|uniref:Uncharacterized protein n=1 Tax=Caerostris darwini TaxID=1538125 RepID=A0AAV4QPV5_9ARAC|nr:hypothetical protein CDAR_449931 [Caerostris darwini]
MSKERKISRALHVYTPLSGPSYNAVCTSTNIKTTDFLPLPDFTAKEPCLFEFLNHFLQTSDHCIFSYPLMTGISLKLLVHSRRSCKRASQADRDPSLRDL